MCRDGIVTDSRTDAAVIQVLYRQADLIIRLRLDAFHFSDGDNWSVLDSRSDETWSDRGIKNTYSVSSTGSYNFYRLNIISNGGEPLTQIAEVELLIGGSDTTTTNIWVPGPPPGNSADVYESTGTGFNMYRQDSIVV